MLAAGARSAAPAPEGRRHAARRSGRLHAGRRSALALKVSLPEGLHTQSNKPRDPLLIPTELDDRRAGRRHGEGDRLSAVDRSRSSGGDSRSRVFEQEFAIGVQLVDRADAAPGDVRRFPAQPALSGLRRQICATRRAR